MISSQARPAPLETSKPTRRMPTAANTALKWAAAVLCLGALLVLTPFWVPLLLAAWTASVAKPLHTALSKRIHRRSWAASAITVALVLAFLLPLVIAALSLSGAAVELGHRLLRAGSGPDALRSLAVDGERNPFDLHRIGLQQVIDLGRQHGATALGVAKSLFGALTVVVLGVVVFVSAFYSFLLQGKQLQEWLLVHAPLGRGQFYRLSSVFMEVGRGLLVGVVLTAALQGAVATVGYVICGVPQALVLGLVTVFASLIPSVGSGLVWLPVTIGLALSGRSGAAAAMLAIGFVVSLVDNLVRPLLTQYGDLRMNALLLFVALLGGVAIFGAGGLLLGPLLVRLASEALTMLREATPNAFPSSNVQGQPSHLPPDSV